MTTPTPSLQNSQEQPEASCPSKTLRRGCVASGKEMTLLHATCQGVVPSGAGAAVTSPCSLSTLPPILPRPVPWGHRVPQGSAGLGWGCGCSGTAGHPPHSPVALERPEGTCTRPPRGDPNPDPHRPTASSPRDTQEPITGPRGRAAAPWVRGAVGCSCLRGSGLTRGAGAAGGLTDAQAGGRAGKGPGPGLSSARPPLRGVVPAATAASVVSSCQHRGRGSAPRDRSPKPRARSCGRVLAPSQPPARILPSPKPVAATRAGGGGGWGRLGGPRRAGHFQHLGHKIHNVNLVNLTATARQ